MPKRFPLDAAALTSLLGSEQMMGVSTSTGSLISITPAVLLKFITMSGLGLIKPWNSYTPTGQYIPKTKLIDGVNYLFISNEAANSIEPTLPNIGSWTKTGAQYTPTEWATGTTYDTGRYVTQLISGIVTTFRSKVDGNVSHQPFFDTGFNYWERLGKYWGAYSAGDYGINDVVVDAADSNRIYISNKTANIDPLTNITTGTGTWILVGEYLKPQLQRIEEGLSLIERSRIKSDTVAEMETKLSADDPDEEVTHIVAEDETNGGVVGIYTHYKGVLTAYVQQDSTVMQEVNELALAGIVLGSSSTQSAVPSTPLIDYEVNLPDTLFTVYNDINTARQVVSSIYLDNLLAYRQEVKLNNANSVFINNGVGKLTVSGSGYFEKSITPTKITTNASVLVGKKIALSTLFDSKSGSTVYDKLGQPGATWIYGAKTQLNIIKDAIDNEVGINRMILVGCYNYQTRTSDYKTTGDVVTSGATFARGGWCVANFLRHAMQLNGRNTSAGVPNNVSYYLLGLFTSTGVDFVGNDAQAELIRLAVQGKNPPDYNAAVWDYLKTQSGWTGGSGIWSDTTTNRGFINTWLSAKYVNPDNPFFSLTKAQTEGSTNAFSYQIALDRYKTLSDIDFTTRLVVGSTSGSLVTNATSYDVCTPTHIVIEGGENDRSRYNATPTQILNDILAVKDIIKAEIPTAKIGIFNLPNQGVLFPEAYPKVVTTPRINDASGNYTLFKLDMELKAALGNRATQIANGVYYIPVWHSMIPFSNLGDRVGYDEMGELLVMGPQNANNNIHSGLIGQNSVGDIIYEWLLSTFQII